MVNVKYPTASGLRVRLGVRYSTSTFLISSEANHGVRAYSSLKQLVPALPASVVVFISGPEFSEITPDQLVRHAFSHRTTDFAIVTDLALSPIGHGVNNASKSTCRGNSLIAAFGMRADIRPA